MLAGKKSEVHCDGGLRLLQDFVSVTRDEALLCRLRKIGNYTALNMVTYNRCALQGKGIVYKQFGFRVNFFLYPGIGKVIVPKV